MALTLISNSFELVLCARYFLRIRNSFNIVTIITYFNGYFLTHQMKPAWMLVREGFRKESNVDFLI